MPLKDRNVVIVGKRNVGRKNNKILNPPEAVQVFHVFQKNICFPVFLYACTEWEDIQISYLYQKVAEGRITTLRICKWCVSHNISYQIYFPKDKFKMLLEEPRRFLYYLYLKWKGYNWYKTEKQSN